MEELYCISLCFSITILRDNYKYVLFYIFSFNFNWQMIISYTLGHSIMFWIIWTMWNELIRVINMSITHMFLMRYYFEMWMALFYDLWPLYYCKYGLVIFFLKNVFLVVSMRIVIIYWVLLIYLALG